MSEKCGIQGNESEVDVRNSNQGKKDISDNKTVKINLDEDESTNNNSDEKNDEEKFGEINSKVIVSQELEYDGEKKVLMKLQL